MQNRGKTDKRGSIDNNRQGKDNESDGGRRHTKRNRNRQRTTEMSLLYANVNGIISKMKRLEVIAKTTNPDVIALTETKSEVIPALENYTWTHKPRKKGKGGGVAIAIHHDIRQLQIESTLEETEAEILWTKIAKGKSIFCIGTYYGKQEGHKVEEVELEYNQLTTHINRLKREGEIILTGDFNAKMDVYKENKCIQHSTRNGKFLSTLIENTGLKVTSLNYIARGLWTRENRHNPDEKSVIDYILATEETDRNTNDMVIDEEGTMRLDGKSQNDHNTILMEVNDPHAAKDKNKRKYIPKKWKINKNTDWKAFNEHLRKKVSDQVKITYDQLYRYIIDAMETTIGRQRMGDPAKPRYPKHIRNIIREKNVIKHELKHLNQRVKMNKREEKEKCDEQYRKYIAIKNRLMKKIEEHEIKRTKEITKKIIQEGGVNSNIFWKYVKRTKMKPKDEYNVLDKNDQPITDPEQAKEFIANYFQNLYKPWEPEQQEENNENARMVHQNKTIEDQQCEPIHPTKREFKEAISKIKNGKAMGPDEIPNEAITKAEEDIKEIYRRVLKDIINQEAEIPPEWKEGHIITIYKGKGKKGQLCNERGITLSSNMGKLAERVIANRISKRINMTNYQAGGKKNSSTSDHLTIINNVIHNNRKRRKPTYICFMDVTKAYDKAWLEGIMHAMHESGIDGAEWKMAKQLSNNLRARVRTNYGLTREFEINDSIKQGGVLSVVQYATLIDEIAKQIQLTKIGCQQRDDGEKIGCLLWMDDVVLVADNPADMQKMIQITQEIAKKYRIKFGEEKTKTMTIGRTYNESFKMGEMEIGHTERYKYLGYMLNNKANSKDHLQNLKGKAEIAYQTIQTITSSKNFRNMHMASTWKLLKTTVIPIITYASEAVLHTKAEMDQMNKILDNIIKRILNVPRTTPREPIYLECGLLDIESTINKNKLLMYNRIYRCGNELTKEIITTENKTKWMEELEKIMNRYNITKTMLEQKKTSAKKTINKAVKETFQMETLRSGLKKSKVRHYLLNRDNTTESTKDRYIYNLTVTEVSTIFKLRTRMIDTKCNFKNKYENTKCRHCKTEDETQEHILTQCRILHTENENKINYNMIKTMSNTILREIAKKANYVMQKHHQKELHQY